MTLPAITVQKRVCECLWLQWLHRALVGLSAVARCASQLCPMPPVVGGRVCFRSCGCVGQVDDLEAAALQGGSVSVVDSSPVPLGTFDEDDVHSARGFVRMAGLDIQKHSAEHLDQAGN